MNNLNNSNFIRQIKCCLCKDVVLLGTDGVCYFGKLTSIDQCCRACLEPACLSSCDNVEILSPAGVVAKQCSCKVDLSQIVAFCFDLCANPFTGNAANADQNRGCKCECSKECTYTTLGGNLIAGSVECQSGNTITLSNPTIFVPGSCNCPLGGVGCCTINRCGVNSSAS